MTPDWIPNIHPFVVHFPVALIVIAVVTDVVRVFVQRFLWLNKTSLFLYITGTLGLMAAYITGQQAVDLVNITGDAISVVSSHEDWALYTTIFFIVFTIVRTVTYLQNREQRFVFRAVMALIALAGGGMLWHTGELGAKLVFKHGVAVGEIDRLQERVESLERELAEVYAEADPLLEEDGSWVWRINPGADLALYEAFSLHGDSDISAEVARVDGANQLDLTPGEEQSYFLYGEPIRSLDGRMELNAADFDGEIMLVHHYHDPDNYQYLKLSGSQLTQGRVENGTDNILQSEEIDVDSWLTIRVTADGRHFYGYKNGQTITHTHADEMEPGLTGFSVRGDGKVAIRYIEFQSVN